MAVIVVKLGESVVQRFKIDKDVVSIGRARDNDIVVENLSVSRNHARIRREAGKYILTDLNSANGCFVNGVKLTKAELAHDDIVSIGKHKLHFLGEDTDAPVAATPAPAKAAGPASTPAAAAAPPKPLAPGGSVLKPGHIGVLIVTRGKQANSVFRLDRPEITIGRSNENDIRLYDWHVSKRHASITKEEDRFRLRDLGSWRGTTVNSASVTDCWLTEQDELIFGTTVMSFKMGAPDSFAESATIDPDSLRLDSEFGEGQTGMDEGIPFPSGDRAPKMPTAHSAPTARISPAPPSSEDSFEFGMAGTPANASSSSVPGLSEDEFAPLTDEELEALENEADEMAGDPELARAAEFEQLEAEKLLAEGGGWKKVGALVDAAAADREADGAFAPPDGQGMLDDPELAGGEDGEDEDAVEEKALFGGPVADSEKPELPNLGDEESAPVRIPAGDVAVPEGVDPEAFRVWIRALRNRSKVVRREAARKLKDLTGIDYDWESEPR